jgi:hypothetical protein
MKATTRRRPLTQSEMFRFLVTLSVLDDADDLLPLPSSHQHILQSTIGKQRAFYHLVKGSNSFGQMVVRLEY